MQILFNFHILLATFYTIFGTNIMIQCSVPVPVCCMFFCFAETPYQMESKRNKTGRRFFCRIFMIFWKKNQCETVPEVATTVAHATTPGGHTPHPHAPLVRWLMLYFGRKKANFWENI